MSDIAPAVHPQLAGAWCVLRNVHSVVEAPVQRHSAKPAETRDQQSFSCSGMFHVSNCSPASSRQDRYHSATTLTGRTFARVSLRWSREARSQRRRVRFTARSSHTNLLSPGRLGVGQVLVKPVAIGNASSPVTFIQRANDSSSFRTRSVPFRLPSGNAVPLWRATHPRHRLSLFTSPAASAVENATAPREEPYKALFPLTLIATIRRTAAVRWANRSKTPSARAAGDDNNGGQRFSRSPAAARRVLGAFHRRPADVHAEGISRPDHGHGDAARLVEKTLVKWRPQRDSNPCFGLERATSWASGRWGREVGATRPELNVRNTR